MSKDAFYFPHDSNARHDPKILKMRSIYKIEGFGLYWATIEMMREQENYLLPIDDGSIEGYALDLNIDPVLLRKFLMDCVKTFNLFQSDETYLWSDSLIRRMSKFDEKSEQAKEAALMRWHSGRNADVMRTHSERINDEKSPKNLDDLDTKHADALPTQSERNAIKLNNIKSNNIKEDKIDVPDFLDKELWADFLEMRKKKKIPNTDRALKLLIKNLKDIHDKKFDANKSLENSIMRGWTGVFPPREENYGRNQENNKQSAKEYSSPSEEKQRSRKEFEQFQQPEK